MKYLMFQGKYPVIFPDLPKEFPAHHSDVAEALTHLYGEPTSAGNVRLSEAEIITYLDSTTLQLKPADDDDFLIEHLLRKVDSQ